MSYEYVKQMYAVNPEVSMRVTFNEKGCARKEGVIVGKRPEEYDHYVHVRFDGRDFDVPCHPLSLEYHEVEK